MVFQISVQAGKTIGESKVSASGQVTRIMTDSDRNAFGLDDNTMKNYVANYFGKRPSDVYVRSPTPWDDLYKTYHWNECHLSVTAVKAEILNAQVANVALATKTLTNHYNQTASFSASISQEIANSSETNWQNTDSIEVGEQIEVDAQVLGIGAKSTTSFKYGHSWAKGGSNSQVNTISAGSEVSVPVAPNSTAVVTLSATNNKVKVRVTYQARVYGGVAINYSDRYKGHHFWCFEISDILMKNNAAVTRDVTEDIDIGLFSEGRIEVDSGTAESALKLALPHLVANSKLGLGYAQPHPKADVHSHANAEGKAEGKAESKAAAVSV